jgi:NAD(P)-dependent dehydrogenase (short-subunit alcohol dehydrogenase family)
MVIECADGGVLAFEVKAAGQVADRDMRSLHKLPDRPAMGSYVSVSPTAMSHHPVLTTWLTSHRPRAGDSIGSTPMNIEGNSAIVVGGASGLGEATVRRLHAAGAVVTIADVNAEKGQALASELGLKFVSCDVREEDQVQAAVERAAADGALRIAICCAGTGWAQKLAGSKGPHPLMPFETIIQINLIGTFNVLRFAATAMLANEPLQDGERGVCVNTASIAAYDGQVGQIAYSASKGGVVGMTLPAARDLAQYGIRVNTIAPGLFDTPLLAALPEEARQKLGAGVPFPQRLGQPDEYGQLACHIIENRMLNGEVIRLDGALRMPPR